MSKIFETSNSKKMELIAKTFFDNQFEKKSEQSNKDEAIKINEHTPKNSLTEAYSNIQYNDLLLKDIEQKLRKYDYYLKPVSQKEIKNLNKTNSINNTRNASVLTENTSINLINNNIKNYEANKQKIYETGKLQEKILSDSDYEEEKEDISINNLIESINEENISQIENLYKELIKEWEKIKLNEDKFKDSVLKKKVLSFDYIHFLFSEDVEIILKSNLKNIEINKFILYQIYIFLSSLFYANSTDEFILRAFSNFFTYSKQNYETLRNNLKKNTTTFLNLKEYESFKRKNKILLSIITTIPSNFPDYLQINKYFEWHYNKNGNDILKLISMLKNNKNLSDTLKSIETEAMEKINESPLYYLSPINVEKYSITIFINLDEVIAYYCDNNNNPYVKIRNGGENFIKDLSKRYEIIMFTESSKEYMDTILDNLNFDEDIVSHRLYCEYIQPNIISDISLLNRNPNKSFIINPNQFLKCKGNELFIKPFLGDENDKELIKVKKILFKYINNNIDNISLILKDVQKKLK